MTDFDYRDASRKFYRASRPADTKPFHYFVSSAANWTTDADLGRALKRQAKRDKADKIGRAWVFRVPLPPNAEYDINEYRPQVEGAEFLDYVTY